MEGDGPDDSSFASAMSVAEELGLSVQRSEEGVERLLRLLARLADVPVAALWIADGERSLLIEPSGALAQDLASGSALFAAALEHDGLYASGDLAANTAYKADPLLRAPAGIRHVAALALRVRDHRKIGLLCLMDTRPQALSEAARAALAELAPILEDRLRLRADVLHDPHTSVLTRPQFDDLADREWRRSMRGLAPLTVLVAELDQLAAFREREGPDALNRGLRALGLALRYSLHRPGDCVGRYDPTRFVVLLPGTDEHGAAETADRLRLAVESLGIPFAGAPTGTLTLSVGIDTVHSEALSRRDLARSVHEATQALRAAQRAGGNRWSLAGRSNY